MVFIDGVFQAQDSYSVSGTTLTFSTAPANGRVITVYHAQAVSIGTPADNTVDTVQLVDGAVTSAKLDTNIAIAGVVTANAGVVVDNITIDGTEINLSSGDLTLDVAGNINLDADGGFVVLKDGGTTFGALGLSGGNFLIKADASDQDILFGGSDGGVGITALTLDMSEAGAATFNSVGTFGGTVTALFNFNSTTGNDLRLNAGSANRDIFMQVNGTTHMTVQGSTGNVGIGTSPASGSKLHVESGNAHNKLSITSTASGGTGYDAVIDLLASASNSECAINMGINGDADREQIKTYQSAMTFRTNNTERLRIDSSGLITAGTATNDRGKNIRNWTSSGYIEIGGDLPGYNVSVYPTVRTNHDYLFFSVNGSYSSHIAGNGTYTAISDERVKTNINTLSSGQLNKITNLRGVNYNWIDENKGTETQMGLIAQELELEYPELVSEGTGDLKGVNYAGLVSPLIEAVKELKLELDAAKARITTLENA